MSLIIHLPSPGSLPDTPDDLPSFTLDDGSDDVYVEIGPGYNAAERAWFEAELTREVTRLREAAEVVRHAEDIARQAVLT